MAKSEEFKAVLKAVGHFAMPAAWGGLGACVFLAKRMSDKLYRMQYEEARTRGYGTRIFLGSTVGVVTASIAFPDIDTKFRLPDTEREELIPCWLSSMSTMTANSPDSHGFGHGSDSYQMSTQIGQRVGIRMTQEDKNCLTIQTIIPVLNHAYRSSCQEV